MNADAFELYILAYDGFDKTTDDEKAIQEAIDFINELLSDSGGIYKPQYGIINRQMMHERADYLATIMQDHKATKDEIIEYHQLMNELKWNPKADTFRFYFGKVNSRYTKPLRIVKWWQFDLMVKDIIKGMRWTTGLI